MARIEMLVLGMLIWCASVQLATADHLPHYKNKYKVPLKVWHEGGTFNDTDAFWEHFDDELKNNQCFFLGVNLKYGCYDNVFESEYKDIYNYLYTACLYRFSNPLTLQQYVNAYCAPRSADNVVTNAYLETSKCRLTDNLNQVCNDMNAAALAAPAVRDPCEAGQTVDACVTSCAGVAGVLPSCTSFSHYWVCVGDVKEEQRCVGEEGSSQFFNQTVGNCRDCPLSSASASALASATLAVEFVQSTDNLV